MAGSPAWRRAFDEVERRMSSPLKSVTGSPDLQVALHRLRVARRVVSRPVDRVVSLGLHVAGLPSNDDLRKLRDQVTGLQRDMLSLHRELVEAEAERARQDTT